MNNTGKVLLIGGAILGALFLATKAGAAGSFICPIDGLIFTTQAELTAHMTAEHPGTRIPIAIKWS